MKLPIQLRTRLFSAGFRVTSQNLQRVPSLSITDLGLLPLLGCQKSLDFLGSFHRYRHNMRGAQSFGLTSIYPRSYYLLYFFLLFWWADYCNALEMLVESPDHSRIAELFFRYVIEADRLIDESPDARYRLRIPSRMKQSAALSGILRDFFVALSELVPSHTTRRQVCHHFWTFRQECLKVCQDVLLRSDIGLDQVLYLKQRTTGGLFRTWSALLGDLYLGSTMDTLAENSGCVLYKASMAMQVWEDLLDLPADYALGTPNIVHGMLRTLPDELKALESYRRHYKWQHMDGIWARENLPRAFEGAMKLVNDYVAESMKVSLRPNNTARLCHLISREQNHPMGI